jgi:putative MATE family efflux protein
VRKGGFLYFMAEATNVMLESTKISKLIRKFALPAILSNLVGSLYNIADQIFVGQKLGTVGNAATNIAFPLVLLMVTIYVIVGSGGASKFSLYQGAAENKKAGKVVGNSLVALAISGVFLMAVTLIFLSPLMVIFGAKGQTLELASNYTRIIAIGIPFQILGAGSSMLIRADGSPKYATASSLVGAILNIILDPIFIFTFDMGIEGAAAATIIGQIVGAVISLFYFRKFKSVGLKREYFSLDRKVLKDICMLGLPAGLMQIAVMLVQILMNNILGFYGEKSVYGRDIPIAVSGVVTKINSIFTATFSGISQSCQPIFGYNYGAKKYRRVSETFRYAACIMLVIGAVAVLLFQLFPHQLLEIFQKGNELYIQFGANYLRIFMLGTLVNGITILISNFFPSIGMPKQGTVASLSRQVIFQLPLLILFPLIWGLNGVLYVGPVSDVAAVLLCLLMARKTLKSLHNQSV